MDLFQFEIFCDFYGMWVWIQSLQYPSWKERYPILILPHVAFFIYNNVHPVLFISLFFFTYLTATTLSTSLPVSCKELLPKQTPLTSADFKRQKYEFGCFRHIQLFLEFWLVCALNECSALLVHDLKLLDFFSCDRNVFGNERPNLTRRFCHFGPLQETSDTSLALECESDPAAKCFSLFKED